MMTEKPMMTSYSRRRDAGLSGSGKCRVCGKGTNIVSDIHGINYAWDETPECGVVNMHYGGDEADINGMCSGSFRPPVDAEYRIEVFRKFHSRPRASYQDEKERQFRGLSDAELNRQIDEWQRRLIDLIVERARRDNGQEAG